MSCGAAGDRKLAIKAIFNTAVDDGLIRCNPCRIKGAGQEESPERPVLTIPRVYALADAVVGRCRALVLLGVFGSLRWSERPTGFDPATRCLVGTTGESLDVA